MDVQYIVVLHSIAFAYWFSALHAIGRSRGHTKGADLKYILIMIIQEWFTSKHVSIPPVLQFEVIVCSFA